MKTTSSALRPTAGWSGRLARELLTLPLRRAGWALAIVVGVTAALASQLPSLRRDVRVEKIFPKHDPAYAVYQRFIERFGPDNHTAFCAVELDGDVLAAKQLARIHRWTEELAAEPLVDAGRLTSLSRAALVRVTGEDELEVAPLFEPRRLGDWDRDAVERRLRQHPGFQQQLVSADRRLAALWVPIRKDKDTLEGRRRFVARLRAFFAERLHPGERVFLDGLVVSEIELHTLIGDDSRRFYGIGLCALVLMLWLSFRRVWLVLAATGVVSLSALWTLGLMAVWDIPISFLSAAIPVMIVVASVGDSVYLVTRFVQRLGGGGSRRSALQAAVREAGGACLLTSLTTAAGFFSLLLSDAEIIRELGLPVGVGVLTSYLVTFLCLPPLLDRLPLAAPGARALGPRLLHRPVARLAGRVRAHPWGIIAGAGLLSLVAGALSGRLQVTSRLLEDLGPDEPLVRTRSFLEQHFGGVAPLELLVETDRPGRALDPDVQQGLWALAETLRGARFQSQGLLFAVALPDFLSEMRFAWTGLRPGARVAPRTREEAAQLLLLYEMARPDPTDELVDFDRQTLRCAMRIQNLYTDELFRLADAVEQEARRLLPPDVRVAVTGRALMSQAIHHSLVRGVLESLAVAIACVVLLLMVFLRSPRLALLALVPNLWPLLLLLGAMALAGVALNISTSIIFTVAFGIAVDDTIHFLAGLRERRRRGLPRDDAITATLRETGTAMVLTSLILLVGFGVLLASHFRANRYIGALLSATLAFALVADLLLLPALLHVGLPDAETPVAPETVKTPEPAERPAPPG